MEFWGIEVKPGETVKCKRGDDQYLHLSQASLGEVKKDKRNESIVINVKFNNQKLVIGTLSADKCPQISYDLVFEKDFELSHNWKNGSVFFVGYKAFAGDEEPDNLTDDDSESEDEDIPVKEENGKAKSKGEFAKPNVIAPKADLAAKPSVKADEPKKAEDDDDEDDEDDSEDDESDAVEMLDGEDDSDDEDESSEEEDEETPKKVDGKKRPSESASKTPAPEKKAKLVTPVGSQKTVVDGGADGKKGGHTATPHPAKHAGKTAATNDKSKQQTPKSVGSASCKSCNRTFKDENAVQAHTKAKHAAK